MAKIPLHNASEMVIQMVVHCFLAPSPIPIATAIWVPIKIGPARAKPGNPYRFQIFLPLLDRPLSFSSGPFFFLRHSLNRSNRTISRKTVRKFPANDKMGTSKGFNPFTMAIGITAAISIHGMAASMKTNIYSQMIFSPRFNIALFPLIL